LPNIHSLADTSRLRYFWERGMQKLRLGRRSRFLTHQAGRHHGQILHSHFGNIGWRDLTAAREATLKHVVSFYGLDVSLPKKSPRWRERYRALFKQVDRVLCEGPYMAQSIVDIGCPKQKIFVNHLGVEVDNIQFKHRTWVPGGPLRVLIAGSFREKKGIPYALEALGLLQHEVDLEVTVIGDANNEARNQAEKRRILAIVEKHDLQSKTRMLGYQPHVVVFDEAYKHHIYLAPSVTAKDDDVEGGAPVTIIEMAATGMPVVSTRHCDIPMVIRHGVTGLLAEERDVDGLIRNLKWLVDHPERWHSMVQAGRRHVELEFNARLQGKRLLEIYEEVIS
jgi:colanic acid/amylovoran biosynthesis glycosyltransferase